MKRLIIGQHGLPEKCSRNNNNNPSLCPEGIKTSRERAKLLKQLFNKVAIYSSPKKRAEETAKLTANVLGLKENELTLLDCLDEDINKDISLIIEELDDQHHTSVLLTHSFLMYNAINKFGESSSLEKYKADLQYKIVNLKDSNALKKQWIILEFDINSWKELKNNPKVAIKVLALASNTETVPDRPQPTKLHNNPATGAKLVACA